MFYLPFSCFHILIHFMTEVKVMTFNLRYDNPQDGENRWENRKGVVAQIIANFSPDIFGTQEGWEGQIKSLQKLIPSYRLCVHAPEWDYKRMFPCVWVKEDLEVSYFNTFWLSLTPSVPFSRNWESAYPRSATYVLVKKKGISFLFVCTHLDNISTKARLHQAMVLWQEINRINVRHLPLILVGDFNTSPDSEVHQFLTGQREIEGVKGNLVDVWQALHQPESGTFHAFTGRDIRGRIDWILVSPEIGIKRAVLIKDTPRRRYPSDHFPVGAVLEI